MKKLAVLFALFALFTCSCSTVNSCGCKDSQNALASAETNGQTANSKAESTETPAEETLEIMDVQEGAFYEMRSQAVRDDNLPKFCKNIDVSISKITVSSAADMKTLGKLMRCRSSFKPEVKCDQSSFETMCQADNLAVACINNKTSLVSCSSCSAGKCADPQQLDSSIRTLEINFTNDINLASEGKLETQTLLKVDQTMGDACVLKTFPGFGNVSNVKVNGNGSKLSITSSQSGSRCYATRSLFSQVAHSTIQDLTLDYDVSDVSSALASRVYKSIIKNIKSNGTVASLKKGYAASLIQFLSDSSVEGCSCSNLDHYTPNAKAYGCVAGHSSLTKNIKFKKTGESESAEDLTPEELDALLNGSDDGDVSEENAVDENKK